MRIAERIAERAGEHGVRDCAGRRRSARSHTNRRVPFASNARRRRASPKRRHRTTHRYADFVPRCRPKRRSIVRRRDGDRADCAGGTARPNVVPRQPAVRRFEYAAAGRAKIIEQRIAIGSRGRRDATARARPAHVAPFKSSTRRARSRKRRAAAATSAQARARDYRDESPIICTQVVAIERRQQTFGIRIRSRSVRSRAQPAYVNSLTCQSWRLVISQKSTASLGSKPGAAIVAGSKSHEHSTSVRPSDDDGRDVVHHHVIGVKTQQHRGKNRVVVNAIEVFAADVPERERGGRARWS